jgi:3-hydroxyacyl-CoA dehydrogenase
MSATQEDVRAELRADGVLVLTLDQPPANALGRGLRARLIAALLAAPAQGARAVVICGAGRNFSAATAMDTDQGAPTLADLCALVEDMPLPVVVALTGATVGPGAELALAAHARVMAPDARIVCPEVGLGLVPEAGTTQRLPRLVGAAEALRMLLRAHPVSGAEAVATGLADELAEGDVLQAAVAMAAALPGPRPVRDRADGLAEVGAFQEAVTVARAEAARGILPAPQRIIDCVEAALMLPFANGLAMEAVAREDLVEGAESRGLIAAALAERRAVSLPAAVARVRPKAVARLGLVGGAPQMAALALVALNHGLAVAWVDPDDDRRTANARWIDARLEADLRARRLSVVQRDADRARLVMHADLAALGACDLVLHGAAGEMLARLGRAIPAAPQLVMGGAEGAMGLGLAPSARLAELALPAGARPEHVAVAVQFLRRLGLTPVLQGKMPIVGRRVSGAGRAALARLLALGVPRRVLAAALDGFGHALPDLPEPSDPAPMRAMAEDEVLRRWQGAMANEGLKMLDARVALRPSDIDLVLVAGYGFPRWRGGPMHHAAERGLMVLRRDLRGWAGDDAALWAPHPLLDRLIAEGRRLADLDAALI